MSYKIILVIVFLLALFALSTKVLADTDKNMPLSPSIRPVVKTSLLFDRIALCESGNDPHAKNKYSSASGRFQFIYSSWYHYGRELWGDEFYKKNVWDYDDNTELAWYVFNKYGSKDWSASSDCWGKTP